jgi:hypothetical protein
VELLLEYALQRLSNYTVSAHPYATKRLHTALVHNSPGPARTSAPVYSYHAKGDELVPVRVADNFVARACKFGDRVQIVRPAGGSHNTELLTGAPGAINFLAQRFAGAAVVTDCP